MTALLCNLYNCLNSSSSNRKHYIGLRFDKWNSQVFSGCIGLYRSKITNNGPKIILKENNKENNKINKNMFSQCKVESPLERGRMMSLSEVLEEMFGFNPNATDEERNGRNYSTEVQNTK